MTIYVDDFRRPAKVGQLYARWSHLVTDAGDLEELHDFAANIGLKREWFQEPPGKPSRPHYDVTDTKRVAAIRAGATPISWRELPDILARHRVAARRYTERTDGVNLGEVTPE